MGRKYVTKMRHLLSLAGTDRWARAAVCYAEAVVQCDMSAGRFRLQSAPEDWACNARS